MVCTDYGASTIIFGLLQQAYAEIGGGVMNARQKAKKLKKENDLLKGMLVKPREIIVTTEECERLKAQCTISRDFIDKYEESEIDEYIRATISAKLAYYMGPKLILREQSTSAFGNYTYTTDIWVGYGKEEVSY